MLNGLNGIGGILDIRKMHLQEPVQLLGVPLHSTEDQWLLNESSPAHLKCLLKHLKKKKQNIHNNPLESTALEAV